MKVLRDIISSCMKHAAPLPVTLLCNSGNSGNPLPLKGTQLTLHLLCSYTYFFGTGKQTSSLFTSCHYESSTLAARTLRSALSQSPSWVFPKCFGTSKIQPKSTKIHCVHPCVAHWYFFNFIYIILYLFSVANFTLQGNSAGPVVRKSPKPLRPWHQ